MSDPLRILLIEDLSSDIELIKRELKNLDIPHITQAVKNESALRSSLSTFKPDIVLSDYLLPGFSGKDALEIVKQFDPDLPFIIVTGSMNELTAVDCMKAGAWDYVIKEKLVKLVPAILSALEKKKLIEKNKAAQKALEESEKRFRSLVESAPFGIVVYDKDFRLLYANQSILQLAGIKTFEAIKGLSALKFAHPDDQEKAKARIGRILSGEFFGPIEEKLVRLDGRVIDIEIYSRPFYYGDQPAVLVFVTDITERKKDRKLLDLQSAALNAAANAIVITDIEGSIQWVNPAFTELTGYAFDEVIGENPRILKSGKHDQKFYEKLWNTVLAGKVWHGEIINKHKDGHLYTEEMTITPVHDDQNRINNFISIKQDITERKQAELRLQNLIEQSNDAIYLLYNNKFEIINRRFTEMFGYTLEECNAPDFNFMHLVAPESRGIILQRMEAVKRGEKVSDVYEFTAISKSGQRIICEASVSYIQYKEGIATQGIIRDITERRQSEEEIRKLSQAIEQSPIAVIIINKKLKIEYANPAFTKITGFSLDDLLTKRPFEFIFDAKSNVSITKVRREIKQRNVWQKEMKLVKKDGSFFYAKVHIAPVINPAGKITHYSILVEDVSELKKLQEQFLQAQKMEAVGRLAGGVAHDFNNLLTVINGYSELLMSKVGKDDPLFEQLVQIKKAGDRASALTSQLLAFSRKQVVQPKTLNLNNVLHDMEKMLKRLIGEDIYLSIFYNKSLGLVKADPAQIEQVIMNIIVNARDAMPKGGKITIELKNRFLGSDFTKKHPGAKEGWYAAISITDTGIGMDKETQAHIFEPFFSTKEKGKGTGLGLATVYGIVKQSGGYIQVYSEVGQGTTFHVYLPIINEQEIEQTDEKFSNQIITGSETILVVEDEESVKDFVLSSLQEFGYRVLWAQNITVAKQILEEHSSEIDLLLTDVIMPGGSGADLVAYLKKANLDVKVLYMSGYTDDSVVRHGILPENTHFIQKPFSVQDLAIKVREVLDK